jgi:sugar phosphate permease
LARGNPVARGYKPVNPGMGGQRKLTFKQGILTLLRNVKTVIVCPYFWCCAFFALAVSGIFYDLSGMWIAPWLRDLFGMSKQEAGNTALSLSIGSLIGALGIPVLSSLVRTKKWTLTLFASLLTAISLLIWQLDPAHIPYGLLYFLLMLIGGIVCGCIATCYPYLSDYFEKTTAGTAVGCANIFAFLASGVFQAISSEVIESRGKTPSPDGRDVYTLEGYKVGLWLIFFILSIGATISIVITKEVGVGPTKSQTEPAEKQEKEAESEVE